jgi:translation initiation factor 3 subunit A
LQYLQAIVAIDVEDLEVDATPEDLMLSYVSGEKGQVRMISSPVNPS